MKSSYPRLAELLLGIVEDLLGRLNLSSVLMSGQAGCLAQRPISRSSIRTCPRCVSMSCNLQESIAELAENRYPALGRIKAAHRTI
jgi:hypothetical protein